MAKCVINNAGGANGVMIQILNFFVGKGYTPTQACAIAGNISVESSGYNPGAKEDGGKGEGIGLCQWSFSRKKALKDYTANMPGKWQNVGNQLEYLWYELEHDYSSVGKHFRENTKNTLSYYTDYWCDHFEAPDPAKAHKDRRFEEAKKAAAVYNQMNKGECAVDTSGSSGGENGGFSCVDGTSYDTVSDLNIVDTSIPSDTNVGANGDTSTSSGGSNYNTRPLIITDLTGKAILTSGQSPYDSLFLTFSSRQTPDRVKAVLKQRFSNKNYKPKFIAVWFVTGGLKFSDDLNKCKDEIDSFVTYKISAHTGFTNIYWFSSLSLTSNAVNPTDEKDKRTKQYLLNQAAAQHSATHFRYNGLSVLQTLILQPQYGYRTRKNGKYLLTQKAMDEMRKYFFELTKNLK